MAAAVPLPPRIITGNRGLNSKILVYDGFKFQLNQKRMTSFYWRCWNKTCRTSLKTNVFDADDINAAILVLKNNDDPWPTRKYGRLYCILAHKIVG